MSLCRVQHNKNYTVINNTIVTDARLSWKAKGIWLYAFSRPDDWQFYVSDLIKQSTDGRDSVYAGLKELENAGYLIRERVRLPNGTYDKNSPWVFYETPNSPHTDYPDTVIADRANRTLLSTDSLTSTDLEQINNICAVKDDAPIDLSKPKITKTQKAENVFVTDEEHRKLIDKFGMDKTLEGYEDLAEWKNSASASQVKKHSNDYYRLRKWVIPSLIPKTFDNSKDKPRAFAPSSKQEFAKSENYKKWNENAI